MIKRINETLFMMLINLIAFGLLAQTVGLVICENILIYTAGLWIGIVFAGLLAVHMERTISKALDLDEGSASKHMQKQAIIRYAAIIVCFMLLSLISTGLLVPCFIGVMGLKVAAYLQPVTNKIFLKVRKGEQP